MKLSIRNELDVAPDVYWSEYLTDEHVDAMYRHGVGCDFVNHLGRVGDIATGFTRRTHAQPRINAPAIVKKLFGKTRQFTEEGVWDPKAKTWSYNVITSSYSDRIGIRGVMRTEPLSGDRCAVIVDIDIDVRLPLIAGPISRFIAKQFEENLAKQVAFTRRWLADRSAA